MSNIGYLCAKHISDSRWLGGLLVVDELGLPIEFKHTEPCEPSGLARLLHGGRLEWHLKVNVVGLPLISAITSNVAAVICDENVYLRLQPRVKHTLATITLTDQQPLPETGQIEDVTPGRWLVSHSSTASPIIIALADEQGRTIQKISDAVIALVQSVSVLEPMERLRKAIDYVAREKDEERSI
ncbi:hypothetical protein J7K50_08190 [bacterium]|nr:hypothetical protein [bacterium]